MLSQLMRLFSLIFQYLILARDPNVDVPFINHVRNIRGWEENESNVVILNESDILSVFLTELDIGALEEIKDGGV